MNKMNKQNHLLIEVRSQETPAVAVLSDVDITNLPELRSRITDALKDHHDTDVTCGGIEDWVATEWKPTFSVEYTVDDGSDYTDIAEISPIWIYSQTN